MRGSVVDLQTQAQHPAGDFDQLLNDDFALHNFMAFLREEFSEENVIFWRKCEEYRKSVDASYRKQLAQLIYVDHVAESSTDQVNIDADVRQTVERHLSTAPVDLFDVAQRQIYLLMKYDPYPRYVKSQRCAEAAEDDVIGLLPPPFDQLYDSETGQEKDRRRWSLLPNWLADRRRRASIREDVDECRARHPVRRESSGGGLTRFIKRLSQGDRKTQPHLPPPPPTPTQRRGERKTQPPTTPANGRAQAQPSTGSKRGSVQVTRTLAAKRSTSVVGLNLVGTGSQTTLTRSAAQRAIKYR